VVASRVKDITSAGGGSDAVANSAFWWNDDFSASTRIVFHFADDSVQSGRMFPHIEGSIDFRSGITDIRLIATTSPLRLEVSSTVSAFNSFAETNVRPGSSSTG
jgi:hypothetical protein